MMNPSRRDLLRLAALGIVASATACDETTPDPVVRRFPDGFVWGAATSAYQVEGAASTDGRGESIWDRFSATAGKVHNGDTGAVAADHYHRYGEDVALMAQLGLKSYRFSVAWPRIQPAGSGVANQKGLDFYKRLVDELLAKGIQPMATLFHWDLPQVLQDAGGWESRDTASRFGEYATLVGEAIGDRVRTILTINEPKTIVHVGYLYGTHAPGFRSAEKAWIAAHHLMLAHGLAVQALRATGTKASIGPALNLHPTYPAHETHESEVNADLRDGIENRFWLDSVLTGKYPDDTLALIDAYSPMRGRIQPGDLKTISAPVDLLGVQYYNPLYVGSAGFNDVVTKHKTSQATWQQIYPEGLYDILTRVKRDYGDIPLVITENGIPTTDAPGADGAVNDTGRIDFLRDHLVAAHRAIGAGVNLTGYNAWSLLDNFEWAEGYSQRWGLVYVDYPTQRRIPKASAHWYAGVIRKNALD